MFPRVRQAGPEVYRQAQTCWPVQARGLRPVTEGQLEGLVMATRSCSVEPGLLVWLLQHGGFSIDEISRGPEHATGLAAVANGSGDVRELRGAVDAGSPTARLVTDV